MSYYQTHNQPNFDVAPKYISIAPNVELDTLLANMINWQNSGFTLGTDAQGNLVVFYNGVAVWTIPRPAVPL